MERMAGIVGDDDPVARVGAEISSLKDRLIASGARGSTLTKTIIDAIKMKAIEQNDASILEVLDHITTGTGILGNTQAGREAKYEARKHIASETERRTRLSLTLWEKQQKLETQRLQGEAMLRLIENPNADVSDLAKEAARRGLGPVAKWILDQKHTLGERADNVKEDRNVAADLLARAYLTPEDDRLAEDATLAAKKGLIKRDTLGRIFSARKEGLDNPEFQRDRLFRDAIAAIRRDIGGGELTMPQEKALLANDATIQLTELYMAWRKKFPEALPDERLKKLKELRELILSDPK